MPGTAGKVGDYYMHLIQDGATLNALAEQLLEAFHAMQPQYRTALLDIAEVYAERYPAPKGVYIV